VSSETAILQVTGPVIVAELEIVPLTVPEKVPPELILPVYVPSILNPFTLTIWSVLLFSLTLKVPFFERVPSSGEKANRLPVCIKVIPCPSVGF